MNASDRDTTALAAAVAIAQDGIVRGRDLPAAVRTKLIRDGVFLPILKGWYLFAESGTDLLPTNTNLWSFLRNYLADCGEYCLGPDLSLSLGLGKPPGTVDGSVLLVSGGNNRLTLRFGTTSYSILLRKSSLPSQSLQINGLTAMRAGRALASISPKSYRDRRDLAEMALRDTEAQELADGILEAQIEAGAQRVLGGLETIGLYGKADQVRVLIASTGWHRAINPFGGTDTTRSRSDRVNFLWRCMSADGRATFPHPDQLWDSVEWSEEARELAEFDAYHSLSLEGWDLLPNQVTKIAVGEHPTSADQPLVKIVKGYLTVHAMVVESAKRILRGTLLSEILFRDLPRWRTELVRSRETTDETQVSHRRGSVPSELQAMLALLANDPSPTAAVIGHFLIIHLDPENPTSALLARLTMNLMFAKSRHPWTIIRVSQTGRYSAALRKASFHHDIQPLCDFIAKEQKVTWH